MIAALIPAAAAVWQGLAVGTTHIAPTLRAESPGVNRTSAGLRSRDSLRPFGQQLFSQPSSPTAGGEVKTFDFREQLAVGAAGEAVLDAHFSRWYGITPATMDEQFAGVDRWFVRKTGSKEGIAGERFGVEYKTDREAVKTGNAFIELFHLQDLDHVKRGWALSSLSRMLVYYLPQASRAYVVQFADLRRALHDTWKRAYPLGYVANKSWDTWGILVPLDRLERVSRTVLDIHAGATP